ncbi:hypothetical protein GcC1_c12321o12 [Golovinomyces cichoracearum]|uniref:Effector protein n=1 Tax=Golovinomyces cichoracearum TaxID=62708 RepID=A0A420J5E5_9PEZI|nr:hypothetical protein GcC1_c12321o12 [Golovinomyces cichoracearum]
MTTIPLLRMVLMLYCLRALFPLQSGCNWIEIGAEGRAVLLRQFKL